MHRFSYLFILSTFFIMPLAFSILGRAKIVTSQIEIPINSDLNSSRPYLVNSILEMSIDSSINPATYNFLKEGLKAAKKNNAQLILLKLNTPGGLVTTTQKILTLIGESNLPVIVWITPEGASATSAGAILSASAHFIFMAQGTTMGAATPIEISGDIKQKDVRTKTINSLAGMVQSLAQLHRRDENAFAQMVREAKMFKPKQALKLGLINGIASTKKELFKQLKGQSFQLQDSIFTLDIDPSDLSIQTFEMDLGQRLLDIFANPSLAYILFLLGAALLYLELQSPGGFLAGSLGLICLLLAAISFQVLPLNFGAIGLLILSFVLFTLEFYIVSYGILTLGGIASLIFGSLFLYRTDDAYLHLSHTVIFSAVAAIFLFTFFLGVYLFNDRKKNRGKLKDDYYSVVGAQAVVMQLLKSTTNTLHPFCYQIKIHGEIWKAVSHDQIDLHKECLVIEEDRKNLFLIVKKIP